MEWAKGGIGHEQRIDRKYDKYDEGTNFSRRTAEISRKKMRNKVSYSYVNDLNYY